MDGNSVGVARYGWKQIGSTIDWNKSYECKGEGIVFFFFFFGFGCCLNIISFMLHTLACFILFLHFALCLRKSSGILIFVCYEYLRLYWIWNVIWLGYLVKYFFSFFFSLESQNVFVIFKMPDVRFHNLKITIQMANILDSLAFINWRNVISLFCEKKPDMFLGSKFTGIYTPRCLRGENNLFYLKGMNENA